MPFTRCLGCDNPKNRKTDSFYLANSIPNSLVIVNNLRQKYNSRKRQLNVVDEVPHESKICKSCYDIATKNSIVSTDHNIPDLSYYREGRNSHTQCIFGCRKVEILISVPKPIRRLLLMEYKFLVIPDARICSEHLGIENYWPLVKQITKKVDSENQIMILCLITTIILKIRGLFLTSIN